MPKPLIVTWVEQNAPGIECATYATLGQGAYAAAIGSAFTAQWYATGGFALVGGAAELAYNLAGCNTPPPPPIGTPSTGIDGCSKVAGGYGTLQYNPGGNSGWFSYASQVTEIVSVDPYYPQEGSFIRYVNIKTVDVPLGQTVDIAFSSEQAAMGATFRILVQTGTCEQTDGPGEPTHSPGEPIADPYIHTEEDCEWTIQATDAYVDEGGRWHTYYTITANNDACGGPFAYWSSEDGPNFVPVVDPDGGPNPPPGADCCREITDKLDEIKDCACNEEPPIPEGDFRTISFRSDEPSPYGTARLRKRFRYRSVSGNDLGAVVDHWKDFSFEAGPYRVRWVGGPWGSVEVWAATEAEGKRVIQHAAGEAGLNPFESGRWSTRVSSSSRLGVSGTMRVDTKGGYYWITARDGSDGRPIVALT